MAAKYRLAIFDFDGTLVSSLEGIHRCMTDTLIAYGYPPPSVEDVRKTIGLTLEDSVSILTNRQAPESHIPAIVKLYRGLHDAKAAALISLFDGAPKLLEAVAAQGTKLVVVSNKGRAALEQVLERLKIWFILDLALSAEDVQQAKPAPELYTLHIAPRFRDISPAETLVIGDTEIDIQFARAAGLTCCWASYGYGNAARCRALKPEFEIGRIAEVLGVLQGKRS